jgi:phenylalanyl-tRNA synthetase beta chain
MEDWSGATIGYKKNSATNAMPEIKPVPLTKKKLHTYLLWSDMDESTKILEGFGIRRASAAVSGSERPAPVAPKPDEERSFIPPTWRPDVTIEEDLIEEIGRYRGYNETPDLLPGLLPRRADAGAPTKLAEALRACALARGYVEVLTYSFLPESFVKTLYLPDDDPRAHPLLLANPISQDWIAMRTTLLPGLLNGLRESVASGWRGPVRIFEIGRAFLPGSLTGEKNKEEHLECDTLAALVFNGTDPRTPWADAADDFLSVKADVAALLQERGAEPLFARGAEPFGHAGQSANVLVDGQKIGFLVRLKPSIEQELAFTGPVYVFELRISPLESPQKPVYRPASPFPATFRDISMLVPNDRTQDEALAEIRAAAGDLLESVKLFDLYDGRGVPAGYRSMAFSLCYRAFDRTLNDAEIDKVHNTVRDTLTQTGYNMR